MLKYLSKYDLIIFVALSISLLLLAAFINTFPLWLTMLAWVILISCILVRILRIHDNSPYKQSFYLLGLLLIFGATVWLKNFIPLFIEPSFKHLIAFIFSRAFLFLIAFYFAGVCVFYSKNNRDREHRESLSALLKTNIKGTIIDNEKTYLVHIKDSEPIRVKAESMVSDKDGVHFYAKGLSDAHTMETAFFPNEKIIGVTEESSFVSKGR